MVRKQVRVSIDEKTWNAAEAVASALGMSPSQYVERALNLMLDPVEQLANAAKVVRNATVNLAETQDQIRVIADFVVDRYRGSNEG